MNIVSQSPDSNEPAAIGADLDAMAAASRARYSASLTADATELAEISTRTEPRRTLGYASFAARLLHTGLTWNAYIGTGLDHTAGVTSVRIALNEFDDVLLDPDEAIAHATRVLHLAHAAKAGAR